MPILSGYLEGIAHSFYDTLRLPKAQVFDRFELFQQTHSDVGKFGDTNMQRPGTLVIPEKFVGRRLWIDLLHASPEDLCALKSDCKIYLLVNTKVYMSMPASVLVLENTFKRIIDIIGKKKLRAREPFRLLTATLQLGLLVEPLSIDVGDTFSVRVSTSQPLVLSSKFAARIFFEGTLYRPVN